ncbi:uncharacterized protein LOC116263944 [Nymphaea colorata]|nr:uncharacterized protein LOC116263944 [Nymphaea colorata]
MGPRSRRRYQRGYGETLSPLMEGPYPEDHGERGRKESSWDIIRGWVRTQIEKGSLANSLSSVHGCARSDPKLLLGVLGCPLAPVPLVNEPLPHISIKGTPFETSSAHYIIHQYVAATGCTKLQQGSSKSMYAVGTVTMSICESEMAGKSVRSNVSRGGGECGCFVLWQMCPDMWSVELAFAGSKIVAGSDGRVVWRHTPWLGTNAAKGPPRPLRRIVQGLDPRSTAGMFAKAQCLGEKRVGDDECFVLKVAADRGMLAERSDGPAEVIRHVLYGYFSQRSGLLVYLEDSHLTRVDSGAAGAVYWETMIGTNVDDYREVDGVLVAHSGRSVAKVFRFGDGSLRHSRIRLEERWRVEDVVFNVPGLSVDTFLPPSDILSNASSDV